MTTRKLIVAALIQRDDGAIILTRRRSDQPVPDKWEFPGGKVELGESPEAGLVRELREELGVSAKVDGIWDVMYHAYPTYEIVMLVYRCTLASDDKPEPLEVAAWCWVMPSHLSRYDIVPADAPLVSRLQREFDAQEV